MHRAARNPEIVLVRHGETEWSRLGRHTGRTDLPLTEHGRSEAVRIRSNLAERTFSVVLTSPSLRAVETCRLAGFSEHAQLRDDLREWDYGDYEGMTTAEIRERRSGWDLWADGVIGGETIEEVGARADRVIAELRGEDSGDALVFAHGHLLRILAARWLELEPRAGRLFALDPATLSVLGYEHARPVLRAWNQRC